MTNPKPRNKNALIHGVYAKDVVLPWEDEKDFEHLLQEGRKEFSPETPLQEETVFDIAVLRLKKRRLLTGAQIATRRNTQAERLKRAFETRGTAALADHLSGRSEAQEAARERLSKTMTEFSVGLGQITALLSASYRNFEEDQDSAAFSRRLENIGELLKVHGLAKQHLLSSSELAALCDDDEVVTARPYQAEAIEKDLRVEAALDKAIEKKMAKLVQLKEFQRLYCSRPPQPLPKGDHIEDGPTLPPDQPTAAEQQE
ncbi:hypothetical protein [uncultured Bradyrhizobium sp.]|jgi:hypothetical protein|uniref:hypothetical protein n=1 Tax=uncultured Bradyrhizobium sp. TaxID=199684 RepID=UPI002638E48D|nr:hypothetical protein [uncultured Bradyrhizobium sp.]